MTKTSRRLAAFSLLAALFATIGCSDQFADRVEVSGTIKLKGAPIKDGAIVDFSPADGQSTGTNTATSGGAFKISREGGLKPGSYLVRVSLGDGKTAVNPVDPGAPPGPGGDNIISKELVPADWNTNSKQKVTVTKEGPNKFDFDIK